MAKTTYLTIKGELKTYNYNKPYPVYNRKKKPRCKIIDCNGMLRTVHIHIKNNDTTIAYFCVKCGILYTNGIVKKVFKCRIEDYNGNIIK